MEVKEIDTASLVLGSADLSRQPKRLWYSGRIGLLDAPVIAAIVGTRQPTDFAVKAARSTATTCAEEDALVMSGMALGVDGAAHWAAIRAGGYTAAVMGTPITQCYPIQHEGLYRELCSEHLCLSQFPPGSKTSRGNFPIRNRLMAFLSDITIVIEASNVSGTIHQVEECIRLGRPVMLHHQNAADGITWWEPYVANHPDLVSWYSNDGEIADVISKMRRASTA